MSAQIDVVIDGVFLGITATIMFDMWILLQKSLGLPTLNFAYLGRWVAHFKDMKFIHTSIGEVSKVRLELYIGIAAHYLIGILIAFLLLISKGALWLQNPDIFSAVAVGIATVVFPLLIMQPAMGAGIASRNTAYPIKNSLKSAFNHMIFGLCLYWAGLFLIKLKL